MVFEKIRSSLKGRNDPFSLKGLEQFTPDQREKILGKISNKETEIMELKANAIASKRIAQLERKAGIRKQTNERKSIDVMGKLQKFKKFRQDNLLRQTKKDIQDVQPSKIKIKPIKLKAPPK